MSMHRALYSLKRSNIFERLFEKWQGRERVGRGGEKSRLDFGRFDDPAECGSSDLDFQAGSEGRGWRAGAGD